MKNLILGLIAVVFFSNTINGQENVRITAQTFNEFKQASKVAARVIEGIKGNPKFKSNPAAFEGQLKEAITPLVPLGIRVMAESGVNATNVPELSNTLTDDQVVAIGTLIISQEALLASAGTVAECIGYAFLGVELSSSFWGSFTTRKALLKAIGKVAAKYLGVIGTALIVYDFADCMDWL